MTKYCSKCGATKSRTDFNKQTSAKDGLHNRCRDCSKAAFKAYIPKEKLSVPCGQKLCKTCDTVMPVDNFIPNKDGAGGYYSVCRGCCSKRSIKQRSDVGYKVIIKRLAAEYTRNNRDKANAKSAQRRANRLQRTPKWVDKEYEEFFLKEIHNLAVLREEATGFKWQVDHSVPFQSEYVSGLHCSNNMQLIPAVENLSKGNRFWPDMW